MIDLFSLGISHGLMMLAAWRLLFRDDLDREEPAPATESAAAKGPRARA